MNKSIKHHRIDLSAELLASSLDQGRRVKQNRYIACCPAHDDRSPSFVITQASDKVLFHCFAGCTQGEVIDALIARGLWAEKGESKPNPFKPPEFTPDELEYMHSWCLQYSASVKRGEKTTEFQDAKYRRYQREAYKAGVAHG